jgi:hypothetical protein
VKQISSVLSVQRGLISRVSPLAVAAKRAAARAESILGKLRKRKGMIEPKDFIPLQKVCKEIITLASSMSSALKAVPY